MIWSPQIGLWRFAPAPLRDVAVLRGTTVAPQRGMPDSTRSLVRTLRQQLGMTQEEFAHEIAVTVSTVNRWENGHANPSKLAWRAIQGLARKRGTTVGGKARE